VKTSGRESLSDQIGIQWNCQAQKDLRSTTDPFSSSEMRNDIDNFMAEGRYGSETVYLPTLHAQAHWRGGDDDLPRVQKFCAMALAYKRKAAYLFERSRNSSISGWRIIGTRFMLALIA
jgi:hypothetical protein